MNYINFKIRVSNFQKDAKNLNQHEQLVQWKDLIVESYAKGDIPRKHRDFWMDLLSPSSDIPKESLLYLILSSPAYTDQGSTYENIL